MPCHGSVFPFVVPYDSKEEKAMKSKENAGTVGHPAEIDLAKPPIRELTVQGQSEREQA